MSRRAPLLLAILVAGCASEPVPEPAPTATQEQKPAPAPTPTPPPAAPAPTPAPEAPPPSADELARDFAKIEAISDDLSARPPAEERDRLLVDLRLACAAFLDAHLAEATGSQLVTASRLWLGLALREPDLAPVRARLAQLRALEDPPAKLLDLLERADEQLRTQAAQATIGRGSKAPAWTARDLKTGAEVTLESQRGKVVLLDFWATWCAPCLRLSAKELAPLHARYGARADFALIGFGAAWNDSAERQLAVAEKNELHWQKVFDAGGTLERYGIGELPYLVLIDGEGTIVVAGVGAEVIGQIKEELARRLPDADAQAAPTPR